MLQVKSSQELCRRQKIPSLDFAETAEAAFLSGPVALQKFSETARQAFSLQEFSFGTVSYISSFFTKEIP
jgi:hypothetical protein